MYSCTMFISINKSYKVKKTHSSRRIDLVDILFDFSSISSILIRKWVSSICSNNFIWNRMADDHGPHSLVIPPRGLKWYLIRCRSNNPLLERYWAIICKWIYDSLMGTRRHIYFLCSNELWYILVHKVSLKRNRGTFWSLEKISVSIEKKKYWLAKH